MLHGARAVEERHSPPSIWGPLRGDEALSLVGNFIDATHTVASACIERAGGNPLFLEQLLRNAQEGSRDAIPASIQSLVQA